MKLVKNLALALSVFLTVSFTGTNTSVYVCDSSTSVAYHATVSCRGLNRCSHEIIKVSQKDAINSYGKRACKICY